MRSGAHLGHQALGALALDGVPHAGISRVHHQPVRQRLVDSTAASIRPAAQRQEGSFFSYNFLIQCVAHVRVCTVSKSASDLLAMPTWAKAQLSTRCEPKRCSALLLLLHRVPHLPWLVTRCAKLRRFLGRPKCGATSRCSSASSSSTALALC